VRWGRDVVERSRNPASRARGGLTLLGEEKLQGVGRQGRAGVGRANTTIEITRKEGRATKKRLSGIKGKKGKVRLRNEFEGVMLPAVTKGKRGRWLTDLLCTTGSIAVRVSC